VLHLLYSRFIVKALNSINEISINEPFKGLFCQGMVCHKTYKDETGKWVFPEDIEKINNQLIHKSTGKKVFAIKSEKMSKSKKNIVDPVSIIENYGADTARIFMLSDSPPERNLDWSNSGIEGSRKFIVKVWSYFNRIKLNEVDINKTTLLESVNSLDLRKQLHFCIEKVTKSLDNFQYNVAVASLREFANYFFTLNPKDNNKLHEALSKWVIMMSPLAPHLAEELWQLLGYKSLVSEQKWPKYEDKFLIEKNINLIVQINGKKKLVMNIKKGLTKEQTERIVLENSTIIKIIESNNYKKIIIVPDRVVNLVI
jgi:leucyl-tRNA synthetase